MYACHKNHSVGCIKEQIKFFFILFFYFISFAIMKPKTKKKSKTLKTIYKFGRVIATAKKPITAGPEIKYIKKERKEKNTFITCSTILVRLEILWSYISNRWF